MKIRKYIEFITEDLHETPESYISTLLQQIKVKVDKMFEFQEGDIDNPPEAEEDPTKIKKLNQNGDKMTFKDLGVRLESSEVSKYSKMYDTLTIKFSDDTNTYALIIMVDIKEAIPKDKEKDFSIEDIEKCYIKLKKYDLDTFEVLGQISKNIEVKNIDEEFLIDLKIEMDEKFGGEDEEFEIETE